ncbi:hypothetical protein DL93DRAFT_1355215 [Clavulina sp. PMI_390]|nr:hypothetical protein DL93DRAFT_1355215 [Clavulina sp. PMI_390]
MQLSLTSLPMTTMSCSRLGGTGQIGVAPCLFPKSNPPCCDAALPERISPTHTLMIHSLHPTITDMLPISISHHRRLLIPRAACSRFTPTHLPAKSISRGPPALPATTTKLMTMPQAKGKRTDGSMTRMTLVSSLQMCASTHRHKARLARL